MTTKQSGQPTKETAAIKRAIEALDSDPTIKALDHYERINRRHHQRSERPGGRRFTDRKDRA